jgi:protein involved in polysaccharide export with SLBB domain
MKKILSMFLIFSILFPVLSSAVMAFEYTLATNDTLEIKIIGQKDMDTKQTIAPDGTISLPFVGRVTASGKTLPEFESYLKTELAKYIEKAQIIVYLTPRSIYIVQHNLKTNLSEVKEARTIAEAKAYAGGDYTKDIKYGDVITVDVGRQPDWWEDNWYKVLTGAAVAVGIYATLNK